MKQMKKICLPENTQQSFMYMRKMSKAEPQLEKKTFFKLEKNVAIKLEGGGERP